MAKFRPAGKPRAKDMPKKPGAAFGCIFLLLTLFALLGLLLYYSLMRK
jgi:hypothetical protein